MALALLAALLGHELALGWLAARLHAGATVLRAVPAFLYTRTIQPTPVRRVHPAEAFALDTHRRVIPPARLAMPVPVATPASQPGADRASNSSPVDALPDRPPPQETETEASAASAAQAANPADVPPATSGAPGPKPSDTWPPNTQVRYALQGHYRGPLYGTAQVQWQRDDWRYQVQLSMDIGWIASMRMTSQGNVGTTHLEPEVYEEITPRGERRHVRMGDQTLEFMDGTRRSRPTGVQDTASQFVELAHRFEQADTPLAAGQTVSLWLARPGGADEWVYDVVGEELVYTPRLGPLSAWHLTPRPLSKPRGPITAEMWFAPSLQHLPVRIRISMGEDIWLDLLLESVEQ